MTVRTRRSSENVFRDLGFGEVEAENLRIRADLMIELNKLIETQGLTQAAAAELLGVTQQRVSDLMRGKIDRFSVDDLIEMISCAALTDLEPGDVGETQLKMLSDGTLRLPH